MKMSLETQFYKIIWKKSWEVGCGNTEDDACCDVSTGGNHDSSGGGGCCTDTDGCGNTSVVAQHHPLFECQQTSWRSHL